jgi:methyl-accepting chemotaxis protein-2 (aspartate sensor receptor)
MAAFHTFTPWNWLLVGGTYTEEITREAASCATATRARPDCAGAVCRRAVPAGALVVSRPLARATEAADRIAKGDLDVHLKSTTRMKSAWCCAR